MGEMLEKQCGVQIIAFFVIKTKSMRFQNN